MSDWRIIIRILFFLEFLHGTALANWERLGVLPSQRTHFTLSTVEDKLYAIGGFDILGKQRSALVEEYDIRSKLWTRRADIPAPRSLHAACVVGGKIYIIGGQTPGQLSAAVDVYDPKNNTWESKAPMPTARADLRAVAEAGNIYAIGGITQRGFPEAIVEVYDVDSDTWRKTTNLPIFRDNISVSEFAASVSNEFIYVLGGWDSANGVLSQATYQFGARNNRWVERAPIPTARRGLAVANVANLIFTIGGIDPFGRPLSTVEAYNPYRDVWLQYDDMPIELTWVVAAGDSGMNSGIIYICGYQMRERASVISRYNTELSVKRISVLPVCWGSIKTGISESRTP